MGAHTGVRPTGNTPLKHQLFFNLNDYVNNAAQIFNWQTATASHPVLGNVSEGGIRSMVWSPNGKIMLAAGSNQDTIFEFKCTTPWDLTTMSLTPHYAKFDGSADAPFGSSSTNLQAMHFTSDGRFLLCATTRFDEGWWTMKLNKRFSLRKGYELISPVNRFVSKTGFGQNRGIRNQYGAGGEDMHWSDNGRYVIYLGDNSFIYQAEVKPPSSRLTGDSGRGRGIFVNPNGTQIFVTEMLTDNISRYTLTTPWDINTIVGDSADQTRHTPLLFFDGVNNSMDNLEALTFSPDGKYMMLISRSRKRVWRWDKQ
jgi:WD40 repeat protein